MDDLISRQAAIDLIRLMESDATSHGISPRLTPSHVINGIESLLSAQPEPCEDTVSRQRLLSDLKELVAAWKKYPVMAKQIKGVEAAIEYVEAIPSAQPEIIRCKNCKHLQKWRSEESAKKFGQSYTCVRNVLYCPKPDDFCSYGERME